MITCDFNCVIGSCLNEWKDREGQVHAVPIDLYGGGNVLAVACRQEDRAFAFFLEDEKHLRNCLEDPECFKDVKHWLLNGGRPEARKIARIFIKYGVPFTYSVWDRKGEKENGKQKVD